MKKNHFSVVGIVIGAMVLTGVTTVQAATVNLNNTVTVGTMNWDQDLSAVSSPTASDVNVIDNNDGSNTYMGTDSVTMMVDGSAVPLWDYSWSITADPDPFISGSFSVTNTSSMMQTFDITFGLPISPSFTDGYMTGSLGANFFDADNSGSASLTLNDWSGLIDGTSQMNLFAFAGPCTGVGCSVTIADVVQGPSFYSGDVNSSIGIHMNFSLSSGDTVSFDTLFEVTPIPVPAAIWLFGSGLVALIGFARTRKSL